MAKKKTKRPVQRHVTSVGELRASRAVDAVTPALVTWCGGEPNIPADVALDVAEDVKTFVTAYFQAVPSADATSFEPAAFDNTFASLIMNLGEDAADLLFQSMFVYVQFLKETETWTGTENDLYDIEDLFHEELASYEDDEEAGGDGGLPDFQLPALADGEELAALDGTALVRRASAFLRWLGSGKEVTGTGALRSKDIEPAAATLDLAVRGHAKPKSKPQEDALFDGGAPAASPVQQVRSMYDSPELALMWSALEEANLLEVGATWARPTSDTTAFLTPGSPTRLNLLRALAVGYIHQTVAGHGRPAWRMPALNTVQATLLMAGTMPDPPTIEHLKTTDWSMGAIPEVLRNIITTEALDHMEVLADHGLISMDERIVVPKALTGCHAYALADILGVDIEGDPWEGLALTGAAAILQVKVELEDAEPSIWRRLLLRSDLTLAQLHWVLQVAFDWENSHLHDFRVGDTVYSDPEHDFGEGDVELDESQVTLGEVVEDEGDDLLYTYDFGDNWRHRITVEKVLKADDDDPAARCTGGSGAAPFEDSGGVWGWEQMLAAVADPTHSEHGNYREWMGLKPRQKFDARAFKRESIDKKLRHIF